MKNSDVAQQQSQRELANTQLRLQCILDAATEVSIIATDTNGIITHFSRGAEKLLGYSASELIGTHTPATFHLASEVDARAKELSSIAGRDIAGMETFFMIAQLQGYEKRGEWTYLCKDGTKRMVELSVTAQKDADGCIVGYLGTATDISERKKTESALKSASRLFSRLGQMAMVGGWELDIASGQLAWSESLYDLRDVPKSEGHHTLDESLTFYTPEHRTIIRNAIQECIDSQCPWVVELPMQTITGKQRWVRKYGEAVVVDNKVVKILCSIQDVTKERKSNDELRRRATELERMRNMADAACRAKSEFLANMSHEIRTPLTAILGYAEMLREEGGLSSAPDERSKILDTLSNAGQHLLTVINDILDLSKIEADKMTVESIETPVLDILKEVERLMRTRIVEKGIQFSTRLKTAVPDRILADPTRVRQILINLVGNAAKFTPQGGIVVEVSVLENGESPTLRIDVEDTGNGMTAEQASVLFQDFSQADTTVTRQHGGTGLGLTICRRLARLMGGEVTLAWTQPGLGSRFRLELPLRIVDGAALINDLTLSPSRVRPVIECNLRGKILLVEDGPDNQRIISHLLRKAGAIVEIAEHGGIALEMLSKAGNTTEDYDLILTDMQMPVIDGYTLARTLRQQGYGKPIIALTALAMSEDREKCLAAGCNDYASKPIDKIGLLATCSQWLNEASGPVCILDSALLHRNAPGCEALGSTLN